jgi:diamine N-acetyltransferase
MKEPNIRLRALELEDLDFLYQIENDDRLWELGVSNVPYSRRVLLDYITSASADIYVDNQVRLIVENEQNEQVGILDLTDFDPRHHRAELGIVIKKEFQDIIPLKSNRLQHFSRFLVSDTYNSINLLKMKYIPSILQQA